MAAGAGAPGVGGRPLQRRESLSRVLADPSLGELELAEEAPAGGAPPGAGEAWRTTLLAGGVAGAASRTAVAPLERLKILFQVQGISAGGEPLRHTGVLNSLRQLVARDGVRGLWKGNGLNCLRVVPASATQFAASARCAERRHFIIETVRGEARAAPGTRRTSARSSATTARTWPSGSTASPAAWRARRRRR